MNTFVFVLVVIASNGHYNNNVIPTLEFSTREKCERAIDRFKYDSDGRDGTVRMRCVQIEKWSYLDALADTIYSGQGLHTSY